MLERLPLVLGLLGLGLLAGYGLGIAFKSAAKTLGCLLVVLFVLLQVLAYFNVWHIDWLGLFHQAKPAGHLAGSALQRLWTLVSFNLFFLAGAAGGFAWTLRRN